MNDRIQARRDTLAAQLAQAQQQFTELEQTLHQLDRQICAMAGGLQELDTLLQSEES
jgi:chaperonin cofactor prefoldin